MKQYLHGLTIIGSTRTLYLQRRSPTSNFLGEKGLPVLFTVTSYLKNPLKGRRLWAHCLRGYRLPWLGSHGHRSTRSPGASTMQSITRKWGLPNKLPHLPSMTLSLQGGCTPESFYKLPTRLSPWSYRRQFSFNPPHYAKWNLGWKESPVDISWRLEMPGATTDLWLSSVRCTTCVNEKQILKLCMIFINLSVQSDLS